MRKRESETRGFGLTRGRINARCPNTQHLFREGLCRFTQEEDDPARTLTSIQPEFKRSQRRLGAGAANGRAPKVWDAAQMRWVDGAGAVRALVAKSGVAAEGQQPLFTGWGEESYDWEKGGWEEERKARSMQNVVREEGECTGHVSMCIGRNHEQVGKERWTTCCGKGDKVWTDRAALQKL
ncbi:hypothetical protein B0H14DRAFT_2648102 [Mycena olivaceomarginata]|nr:hypothetical protein B0H14DRAFT_2648102 [Mycena olivaceomarginata]